MLEHEARLVSDNGQSAACKLSYDLPNICPVCKASIRPVFLSAWINRDSKTAYVLFECRSCHNGFIMTADNLSNAASSSTYAITGRSRIEYAPNRPVSKEFPEHINNVSIQFVKIFNQANAAESASLDEVAGIGYRKALEFLIKDYLCVGKSDEEIDLIRSKFLGKVIKDEISNPNIKAVAERAVWLGNDEAHYYRKWETRDIEDLKRLIHLTASWIDMELTTQEYIQGMPGDSS